MKPYKDGYQIGYFGTDNPATEVVERIPFVVEIRKDVVYSGGAGRPRPTSSTSASSSPSTARTSPASPPPTACSAAR